MAVTQTVPLDLPHKVLRAQKTDAVSFVRDLRLLAAVRLYELGRLSSDRPAWRACRGPSSSWVSAATRYARSKPIWRISRSLRGLEAVAGVERGGAAVL